MKRIVLTLLLAALASPTSADELDLFPKWRQVIERERVVPRPEAGPLKPRLDELQERYRAIPYVEDIKNYGVSDHWATREEMRVQGSGDCEDFAIAEYFDLLEAGVPEYDLWILVVVVKQTQELHAVLQAGPWILDRRASGVLDTRRFEQFYTPVYRINRTGWSSATEGGGQFTAAE